MATIDIGKLKPVFKGTYDNSTAYVLDDIVYYNGSSYVAKTSTTGNLPTDTTKWNILASGSGGIYDSTLSIGSANQVLAVSSGGALEFQDAGGGKTLQVVRQTYSNTATISGGNLNGTSFGDYPSNVEISITPQSSTSTIKIEQMFHYYFNNSGGTNWNHLYEHLLYKYSSSSPTSYTAIPTAKGNGGLNTEGLGGHLGTAVSGDHSGQTHNFWQHTKPYMVLFHDHDTPTGETLTYKLRVRSAHAGSTVNWQVNKNTTSNPDMTPGIIILTEMEL